MKSNQSLQHQFDTAIHVITERPLKRGDVGIEIESECPIKSTPPQNFWNSNILKFDKSPSYWVAKPDNSLRNGLEYVTRSPVAISKLDGALDEWLKYIKGTPFREDSIRTSIHVHRNVLGLTINQLLAVIGGWWLLETPIVDTQGIHRRGNLFCLRLQDADYILIEVFNTLGRGRPFLDGVLGDNVKYGALNLAAVERYGSLEFRFLKGTNDIKEIKQWAVFFHELCSKLADYGHINELIRDVETCGSVVWAKKMLPKWILEGETEESLRHKIETNYSYVYALMYRVRDVQVPSPVIYAFPASEEDNPFVQIEEEESWDSPDTSHLVDDDNDF